MSAPVRFRLRLAIPALLLVLAVLGSLSFASFNLGQEMGHARRRAASGLEHQVFSLGNALSDLLSRGEVELAERRFTDAALDPQVRTLVLVDEGGRVRFSTRRQWLGASSQAVEDYHPDEARRALDEHHPILHPATETRLVAYLPLNLKLTQGTIRGEKVGLLFMDYDLSLLLAQVRHEQMVSAAMTMGFWVLVAVLLFLLLDVLVTRKVDRLLVTVHLAEQGDLAARSGLKGQDELSRLGGAFDGLLDQIGASQNDLRESRAFLETIIETLPLMLFMKEAKELRFVRFNKAGEDLLGYPREDLIGKNDYDLFPPEQAEAFVARDRLVLTGRLPLVTPEEPIQTRHKGLRTLHTIKVPMLDAKGIPRYLLGISEDITDGLKLREDRQLLERQLMQTQKLEGLGSLAGGVAHDMNNVLGAILGMASIQQQAAPEGSSLRRSMDIIEQACLRGRALVHGLLGFARKGLEETRVVDLNALVRDEVALLEHTTFQKVRLVMELAEDLHAVHGDPSALSHAL
ncbi:MAG TPA: PAS domain-containing protein, partial [Geothrix sp.]|nr:PAS domain-containing protein [Geothrix sp.]